MRDIPFVMYVHTLIVIGQKCNLYLNVRQPVFIDGIPIKNASLQ